MILILAFPAVYSRELYALALSWPPSFCLLNQNKCRFMKSWDTSNFNIHGLWPWEEKAGQKIYCNKKQDCNTRFSFDGNLIGANLKKRLERNWMGMFTKSEQLWKHEWQKHGSCQYNITPVQYFQQSLQILANLNLISKWKDSGITPSPTKLYSIPDLERASKINASYACAIINSKQYLTSIYMCLDSKLNNQKCNYCKVKPGYGQDWCDFNSGVIIPDKATTIESS